MKKAAIVILALLGAGLQRASAQFSIGPAGQMEMSGRGIDSIRSAGEREYDYFSQARWEAERRRIRNQRNTLEFNASLQVSQTQFDNWSAGGQNTLSARATTFFHHMYKRDAISLDTRFEARLGMNVIDNKPFKNEDEFKFNFVAMAPLRGDFSYAGSLNLRSQFANGYATRDDHTKKSAFMSPGYFDATFGFNWRKPSWPLGITLSPITTAFTTVLDDHLSAQGMGGVTPGEHIKGLLGPSVRADFDLEFCKKVFRYRSSFYSFTNFKMAPQVRWENNLEIRATKYFTTNFLMIMNYDQLSNAPEPDKLQWNFALSVGLAYRFKNK